jgi:hypothetical protein
MMRWSFLSLVPCVLNSCVPTVSTLPVSNASARPIDINGVRLSLELRALTDPAARGLDAPKVLQVTLKNDIESHDAALVNSGLAPVGGGAGGVIQISLRDGGAALENRCLVNASSATEKGYIYLGPGDSITRILPLSCYHPPRHERLIASVTYEDRDPPGSASIGGQDAEDPLQLPCSAAKGLTRDELTRVFRGPLVSNTIEFKLDEP